MNKKILAVLLGTSLSLALPATSVAAGIPTVDAAAVAAQLQQVQAWTVQFDQMVQQINQAKAQYNSISGIRNMGDLINSDIFKTYMPQDYQALLNQGVGNWKQIRDSAQKFDAALSSMSTADKAEFKQYSNLVAINRASAEEAYKTAVGRFKKIDDLIKKINASPDMKDISDLQARIQAEQTMLQNEGNRLSMMRDLAESQRYLKLDQKRQNALKAVNGRAPTKW